MDPKIDQQKKQVNVTAVREQLRQGFLIPHPSGLGDAILSVLRRGATKTEEVTGGLEVKIVRKVMVAVSGLALAGGVALGGAPAASATNWVECGGRVDFYKLTTDGGRQACFSNYGDAPTSLYGVMHLTTGNNSGWVTYMQVSRGTWYDSPYRGHWYYGSFNAAVITGSVHLR